MRGAQMPHPHPRGEAGKALGNVVGLLQGRWAEGWGNWVMSVKEGT